MVRAVKHMTHVRAIARVKKTLRFAETGRARQAARGR